MDEIEMLKEKCRALEEALAAAHVETARAELRAQELKEALSGSPSNDRACWNGTDQDDPAPVGSCFVEPVSVPPCPSCATHVALAVAPDSDARLREVIQRALELGFDRGVASERDSEKDIDEVLRGGA